jgi:exopolysaccharide biosynthesis protein
MALPRGCTVISLKPATKGKGWQVTNIQPHLTHLAKVRQSKRALIACRPADLKWVKKTLALRKSVKLKFGWHVPQIGKARITALTSGVAVLVRGGKRWVDSSRDFRPHGRNPETFGCVSRDKQHLLLAIVDGRSTRSAGITFNQMREYMLHLHCWTGIAFDGGGSTIMMKGSKILNKPSDGHPRKVPDGLFIYRKPVKRTVKKHRA